MDKLYLYEIATNREGYSYERVYVFAKSEGEAMKSATEKFRELNQKARVSVELDKLHIVNSVEVKNGYCSNPSDEGLKTI